MVYEYFVPGVWYYWLEKEILWFCFRRAEPEGMISGRTFARETIALRQREAKYAGRILALQGQNPGQLELRTHSEFGANLSVTPGDFAFLWLRAIPRRSSPAGYILSGSALRKQNHSISFSIQRCKTPGTKDSYTHPTPVHRPYRRRPHLLN